MPPINHVHGRVVIRTNKDQKNFHTFSNGQTIRLERDWNNFDRGYTQQVLGQVLSAEHIPEGAMVLFHFNAIHDVNVVFNYTQLSGEQIASGDTVISITEEECFLWKMPENVSRTTVPDRNIPEIHWNPTKGFTTGLRVFEPYKGLIQGIEPKKLKNVLYITSGELSGKVVHTLKHCDMEITFRNEKGFEEKIIRCRHYENEDHDREEIVAVNEALTEKVIGGELLIGLCPSDCQLLTEKCSS